MEEWRPIPRYEGYYEASSLGRIRSVDRLSVNNGGRGGVERECLLKGRVLSQDKHNKTCYHYVTLCRDGKITHSVHKLIAWSFLPVPREDETEVNHKNRNRGDNRACNLEWSTPLGNHMHAVRNSAHCRKLTREMLNRICRWLSNGRDIAKIAERCGVTREAIYYVVRFYLKGWELHREFS